MTTVEDFENARGELKSKLEEAMEVVFSAEPEEPDRTLYHYTDARGLIGILSTNELWATHARFMNDASEQSYAMEVINDGLKARLPETGDPWMKTFSEQANFLCSRIWQAYEPFLVCFCEQENLLNQWRVYAGTTGYSIGFDSKALMGAGDEVGVFKEGFDLMKVSYVREDQEQLTAAIIDAVVNVMRTVTQDPDTPIGRVTIGQGVEMVASVLGRVCMSFKDPAFSDEREWRMCHAIPTAFMHHPRIHPFAGTTQSGRGDTKVQCRSGTKGLIPYAPMDIRVEWGTQPGGWHIYVQEKRLPIKEVWYGPSLHPENSKFALERLLFQWGYADIPVKGSLIPLRP